MAVVGLQRAVPGLVLRGEGLVGAEGLVFPHSVSVRDSPF